MSLLLLFNPAITPPTPVETVADYISVAPFYPVSTVLKSKSANLNEFLKISVSFNNIISYRNKRPER